MSDQSLYGATLLTTPLVDHQERKESQVDRSSYLIITMAVLIGDMCRGVLFPTLWLNVLRFGGSKEIQGIAVASFRYN